MSASISVSEVTIEVPQIGGYTISIGSISGKLMLPNAEQFERILAIRKPEDIVDAIVNRLRIQPHGQSSHCPMDLIPRISDRNNYQPPLILTGAELSLKPATYYDGAVQSIKLFEGLRPIVSLGGGIRGSFDFGTADLPEAIFVLIGEIEFNGELHTSETTFCRIAHGEQINARFTGKPALYLCWYG